MSYPKQHCTECGRPTEKPPMCPTCWAKHKAAEQEWQDFAMRYSDPLNPAELCAFAVSLDGDRYVTGTRLG